MSSGTHKTGKRTARSSQTGTHLRGRFAIAPSADLEAINASVAFDRRLWAQDIAGSQAHCRMLMDRGILSGKDGRAILTGLVAIAGDIESGAFVFDSALEDIHMNIEARLADRIGEAAGRLHTARSRNDQVATDFRLWVRDALDGFDARLQALQADLMDQAEAHAATAMPGFTHLQSAQPVTFGHHMLAYVEMFGRDRGRFADARVRLNESPLGAAALAGTSFTIDRRQTAKTLGFDRPMANSMDAVSDRDFALEFLAAGSILAVHLSRLAEEIVLWMSEGFRFIRLSDAWTTGSSIMPQKRNPDAAELVRGKAGRVVGALVGLLTTVKGLPLTYSKDLQEDKEPVFDAADTLALSLAAMAGMVRDMQADPATMAAAASKGHATATDLADWLVREAGLPFRRAHQVVGRLVRLADKRDVGLDDLPLTAMQRIEPAITEDGRKVLTVARALASRRSYGGTAPAQVRRQVQAARKRFL
jgi:argininosuccinate lyase